MVHRELHTIAVSLAALCALNLPLFAAQAEEGPVQIALADTPLVLRDGREAEANVVRVAFAPNSAKLTNETRNQLQDLLRQFDPSCVLSVQVVGAASELETAPRLVIDTHLLARERADNVASLARDTGVPADALASIWSVNHQVAQPKTAVWMFLDNSTPACAGMSPHLDAAPLSEERPPAAATIVADNPAFAKPLPRPMPASIGELSKQDAERHSPEASTAAAFSVSFADNSSYLSDTETAKLRKFANTLDRTCRFKLTATVAGDDVDTQYAAWLAERRLKRVAEMLLELLPQDLQIDYLLAPNDGRRQVSLSLPTDEGCPAVRPVTLASDSAL